MLDKPQSSAAITTKRSVRYVAETIEELSGLIEDRGFALFGIIDHSQTAERAGVQMPDPKLVTRRLWVQVMVVAPTAGMDFPLKVLVWEDGTGVSVSYNSPAFLADRHHIEGSVRAPFDAVESIVVAGIDRSP